MSLLKKPYTFLKELQSNNNREWFNANKSTYLDVHKNVIEFADHLLAELQQTDEIETASGKKSLHRIYRDTRFSKDKTPYKNNFSGGFRRATDTLRGGYYFHLQPGRTMVAGGFWGPNPADLLHIRKQIQQDPDELRSIINSKKFKESFGTLDGEQVKTAPKGFAKDDPAIDLLRYKQFLVVHTFKNADVMKADFPKIMADQFKNMRPFFDYMSEILTTDLNGESTL